MATQFEAAITKAVEDGVVAGAAVIAVGKNGKSDLMLVHTLRRVARDCTGKPG